MLQPRLSNRYAVFLTHESEAITYHYERNATDPRIAHELNTVVNSFGYAVKSAKIVYGRLNSDPDLRAEVQTEQSRIRATYTVNGYTNDVFTNSTYRPHILCESQVFELTGIRPKQAGFALDEIRTLFQGASLIPFESQPHAGMAEKRPISHQRTLYASDANPNNPLPLGSMESLSLTYETYGLAFTPSLLTALYAGRVSTTMLSEGGHINGDAYVASSLFPNSDLSGYYWSRSGIAQYPANPNQSFYLPTSYLDPFGNETKVRYYGNYHFLVDQVTDPLGNVTSIDKFDFQIPSAPVLDRY